MRGSRVRYDPASGRKGPIPAHAGQPARSSRTSSRPWAYPRACGAAHRIGGREGYVEGLSPRMRGSRRKSIPRTRSRRPIPAHAGQPAILARQHLHRWAYPRACRAADQKFTAAMLLGGLSPRMQGSLSLSGTFRSSYGPIPAHAGQPSAPRALAGREGAYPRACRAAIGTVVTAFKGEGLSPRMQGSPTAWTLQERSRGPIPAHAGQPLNAGQHALYSRAYPRACRAAIHQFERELEPLGLSPRMQGSHVDGDIGMPHAGPIPAHAGQPDAGTRSAGQSAAYPRACRAATAGAIIAVLVKGLSPRMQGSP